MEDRKRKFKWGGVQFFMNDTELVWANVIMGQ